MTEWRPAVLCDPGRCTTCDIIRARDNAPTSQAD